MICIVLRPFPGPGSTVLQAGTEVDTSEWLHTDRLIAHRYLRVKSMSKKKAVDPVAVAKDESRKGVTGTAAKRRVV